MFQESFKVVSRMFQGYFKDVLRECQGSPFLALYTTVKDESLGLETEGTETLGLVSVSYKILQLIS